MKQEIAEPDYPLTPRQQQFIRDATKAGFIVRYDYSGRGMFGRRCPAFTINSLNHLQFLTTTYATDQLGLGYVVYCS